MRKVTKCQVELCQVNRASVQVKPHVCPMAGHRMAPPHTHAQRKTFPNKAVHSDFRGAVCIQKQCCVYLTSLEETVCSFHGHHSAQRTHPGLSTYLRDEKPVEREVDVSSSRPQPEARHRSFVILCKVRLATQLPASHALRSLEKIMCDLFLAPAP